jgi:hypothetical protein
MQAHTREPSADLFLYPLLPSALLRSAPGEGRLDPAETELNEDPLAPPATSPVRIKGQRDHR